ncbi:MAG: DEAD/DEAH box helicase [Bradymonadales bacterium]|nr:DEAD/DEAH box helicase [Bradymonadales bacterium]
MNDSNTNDQPLSPLPTFAELGIDPEVLRAISQAGYESPLPVQAACFGPILDGRHVVVQSRTGSGKTAAFILPILHRLRYEERRPQLLVLAPTRELALQVHQEFERLGQGTGLESVCLYGGTRFTEQLDRLRRGVHVVVGTPGRVLDHYRRRTFLVDGVAALVLDEADEMLSVGFEEEIRRILHALVGLEQVMLFSATLPMSLQGLISRYMRDPVFLDLSQDRVDVDRIENVAYQADPHVPKMRTLMAVVEAEDPPAAIIFCNRRKTTESVTAYLRRRGFDASLLNSDLSQADREAVMARMKAGHQRLLVATDIAARGIDISQLPCVIHYDLPEDMQLYVHRTGRTGRVDRHGRAISILTANDNEAVKSLDRTYGIKLTLLETPTREETLHMLADRRIREMKDKIDAGRVIPEEFQTIAQEILAEPDAESLVALLVDSYLSAPPPAPARETPQAYHPKTRQGGTGGDAPGPGGGPAAPGSGQRPFRQGSRRRGGGRGGGRRS